MNRRRPFRLALALVPVAVIALGIAGAPAQSPAPAPPAAGTPAPASPTPAIPAPSSSAPSSSASTPSPAPSGNPAPSSTQPANPPPAAASPAPPSTASPTPTQTADPFGEEITLSPNMVIMTKGSANWDTAFDALLESLKTLTSLLEKQGITPSGNSMIVYTSTDDAGFTYLAEIPVEQEPKNLTKSMSMGKSPEGKALKFVHRGSYENMDNTYEAITNHLDDKKLEAKDTFIEEYITDPLKTPEDKLVINVYVPLK
ncbi:MAG: GyrI-like domain-containing protein [Bradyrhizobium sp.]|jgi:effector-binding domain-containing protein